MRTEVRLSRGRTLWLPASWDAFAWPDGSCYRVRRGASTGRRYAVRIKAKRRR